jgi:hypothetical protein
MEAIIIELTAVKAGCAGNDIAWVSGIYGDRGFVASVEARVTDFNCMVWVARMEPARKFASCERNWCAETRPLCGLVYAECRIANASLGPRAGEFRFESNRGRSSG